MEIYGIYPLVTNIAGWNMAIEIMDFPIRKLVIFHSKLLVITRG